MNKETAIELLKIAAQLTETALNAPASTENNLANSAKKRTVEGVFEDCLKAVEAHFVDLVGNAK